MKRIFKTINVQPGKGSLSGLLSWAQHHFSTYCVLNSNAYAYDRYASIPSVVALGVANHCLDDNTNAFDVLKCFSDAHDDWMFGFLTYDLKNQTERLESGKHDGIHMPGMHFFQPIVIVFPGHDAWEIGCLPGFGDLSDPVRVFQSVERFSMSKPFTTDAVVGTHASHNDQKLHDSQIEQKQYAPHFKDYCGGSKTHHDQAAPDIIPRVSKENYISNVRAIKNHIQQGDIYEMNYCVEFFIRDVCIDPVSLYLKLNDNSPSPFSCLYCLDGRVLISSSPERFLKKTGNRLVSQPIKGTTSRAEDPAIDESQKMMLLNDPKERSENVMIVDLVRNDLSRTAKNGSVFVEELFGLYSFKQVHHMISTVVSELDRSFHPVDAIRCAFPMGSMTGAPKIRAMELIEHYEDTKRGLFSGSVGYITPEKDFDFNVVIRSILYNAHDKYLAYMAGSAITAGSDPEKEYNECLLKAEAMRKAIKP